MSQEIMSEKMDISPKYLSSIERGNENPTLDVIIRLADALGVELMEIFNFSHEGRSQKDMRKFINSMIKDKDEEKLKLASKIIKSLYI